MRIENKSEDFASRTSWYPPEEVRPPFAGQRIKANDLVGHIPEAVDLTQLGRTAWPQTGPCT